MVGGFRKSPATADRRPTSGPRLQPAVTAPCLRPAPFIYCASHHPLATLQFWGCTRVERPARSLDVKAKAAAQVSAAGSGLKAGVSSRVGWLCRVEAHDSQSISMQQCAMKQRGAAYSLGHAFQAAGCEVTSQLRVSVDFRHTRAPSMEPADRLSIGMDIEVSSNHQSHSACGSAVPWILRSTTAYLKVVSPHPDVLLLRHMQQVPPGEHAACTGHAVTCRIFSKLKRGSCGM